MLTNNINQYSTMQAIFIWTENYIRCEIQLQINLKFLQHLCERMANIAFIVFSLPFILAHVQNIWHRRFCKFDNQ